jgi:hypothetical protein
MDKKNTFEYNGKSYTMVHPGVEWWFELTDRCTNANGLQKTKYMNELLNNCVSPALSLKDFAQIKDAMEVANKIESFLGA